MQVSLFPDLDCIKATATGIVYLMTDGYLLKFGYSGRNSPKPRSGELRATVLGFMPGTRADERAYLSSVERWSVSGEWFRIPDEPAALRSLMNTARLMGQWKGVSATDALLRVIASNLRRAA